MNNNGMEILPQQTPPSGVTKNEINTFIDLNDVSDITHRRSLEVIKLYNFSTSSTNKLLSFLKNEKVLSIELGLLISILFQKDEDYLETYTASYETPELPLEESAESPKLVKPSKPINLKKSLMLELNETLSNSSESPEPIKKSKKEKEKERKVIDAADLRVHPSPSTLRKKEKKTTNKKSTKKR